jgi:DNA-directed RNA polymerase subunit alpha
MTRFAGSSDSILVHCTPPKFCFSVGFLSSQVGGKKGPFGTFGSLKIENSPFMNVTPKLECLDLRIEELCLYYGRFRFGPLRRGQGITVGNALRRVLLSELSGVAITGVEFLTPDSIVHEFSTLPGVKESVFEILLHLKEAVISTTTPTTRVGELEPQKCSFSLQGPGRVNVQSIPLPPGLQFVNPNQYLATVYSESTVFPVEITIESGQGGSPSDLAPKQDSIHWIPVESTFVPVKKVNYIVEDIEVTRSEMEKQERIIFEVWTNGSVSPQEAIHEGAKRLMELFIPLLEEPPEVDRFASSLPNPETSSPGKDLSLDTLPPGDILIEDLGLSVRSYNCLKRAQIHTVSDLLDYSQQNLLEIKNFGLKSAEEVAQALQNRLGIELPK